MTIFRLQTRMPATIYIRAETKDEAVAKLQPLQGTTVDLRERIWFSDEMLGSERLPEISLATVMTLYPPEPVSELQIISRGELQQALATPRLGGLRSQYVKIPKDLPDRVFKVDLDMQGFIYVQADTAEDAAGHLDPCRILWINYVGDWLTPESVDRPKCPIAIRPYLTLLGPCPGEELRDAEEDEDDSEYDEQNEPNGLKVAEDVHPTQVAATSDAVANNIHTAVTHLRRSFTEAGGRFSEVTDEELADFATLIAQRIAHRGSPALWERI